MRCEKCGKPITRQNKRTNECKVCLKEMCESCNLWDRNECVDCIQAGKSTG